MIGGISVLGSYVLAFTLSPDIRSGLWGGVPEAIRPLYTVCMLLAATGYFFFSWKLVLSPGPDGVERQIGIPPWALLLAYALVLMPSALWLPLTALHIGDPSTLLWLAIRLVLLLVGAGSTVLVYVTYRLARRNGGSDWLAFAGTLPFWLQTAVLDALIWPAYY